MRQTHLRKLNHTYEIIEINIVTPSKQTKNNYQLRLYGICSHKVSKSDWYEQR